MRERLQANERERELESWLSNHAQSLMANECERETDRWQAGLLCWTKKKKQSDTKKEHIMTTAHRRG